MQAAVEERSHSATSSKLAALTEQNIILRQKIEGLEGHLHRHQREMGAIKRALGPWYRPGDGAAGYYSAEVPAGVQHFSASTSAPFSRPERSTRLRVPYHHSYPSAVSPGVADPSVDPIAAFFPPVPEEFETGAPPLHRTSSQLDAHTSFYPQREDLDLPMIAPLDLSTTLEGSLHGLRESLNGLAASVYYMGKRHEIALNNEIARAVEEVGGVRAGLHGLRMQVSFNMFRVDGTVLIILVDTCHDDG
jgi:hypothetical protein